MAQIQQHTSCKHQEPRTFNQNYATQYTQSTNFLYGIDTAAYFFQASEQTIDMA